MLAQAPKPSNSLVLKTASFLIHPRADSGQSKTSNVQSFKCGMSGLT